jgi:hypothetical protein
MALLAEPIGSNATVSEEFDGLRIVIPGCWHGGLVFLSFWLCAWTFAGYQAWRSLFHHFSLFLCIWLIGWACGELWACFAVLYGLGGKQIIVANAETLTCRTEIFGVGRTRSYRALEMTNLCFQPTRGRGRSKRPSRIAFDYGSKTVGFGGGLVEADALELISRIRQRCPIAETATVPTSRDTSWGQ